MIFDFILNSIDAILNNLAYPLLQFAGLDVSEITYWVEMSLEFIVSGWKFLNIFVPGLDVCLGMAVFCITVELIYKAYLVVMWILKKIPVLGVS